MFIRALSLELRSSYSQLNYLRFIKMTTRANLPTNEAGWRTVLSPQQFSILRQKSTEPGGYSEKTPGALEYELKKEHGTKLPKSGAFACAACGTELYRATSKFDSGCGWPAFYEGLPGAIKEVPDADGRRVEIVCSRCDSHLGHVFKGEGFPTPTDERYHNVIELVTKCFFILWQRPNLYRHCVNGICLKYEPTTGK